MSIVKEFRSFISRGNVIDLAVAVIIGGAFGKIVTSLVNDILMPSIGVLIGNIDFKDLRVVLQGGEAAVMDGDKVITPAINEVTLNYGMFIQNIFDFLIIAFCIFLVIRLYSRIQRKEEAKPAETPKPSNEEVLLSEIRDILKESKK
jgi:large conductance mechanosensitive channel